ncbi:hypothetical protein P4S68_09605 [Pseudoalteromonas sp. Hal099]
MNFGGREIKHGVAIADDVMGPYVKSEFNPISNSGHEVVVWNFRGGIASLLTTDGPEKIPFNLQKTVLTLKSWHILKAGLKPLAYTAQVKALMKTLRQVLVGGCVTKYDASWNWNYICRFTPRKQVLDAGTFQNSN